MNDMNKTYFRTVGRDVVKMTGLDMVVSGAAQCLLDGSTEDQCYNCPYYDPDAAGFACRDELRADVLNALDALKQRNAFTAPVPDCDEVYYCGFCSEPVFIGDKYCAKCGRVIKWT